MVTSPACPQISRLTQQNHSFGVLAPIPHNGQPNISSHTSRSLRSEITLLFGVGVWACGRVGHPMDHWDTPNTVLH